MPRLRAVAIPITWILSGAWTLAIKTETLCVPMSIATTEGTASLIYSLPLPVCLIYGLMPLFF